MSSGLAVAAILLSAPSVSAGVDPAQIGLPLNACAENLADGHAEVACSAAFGVLAADVRAHRDDTSTHLLDIQIDACSDAPGSLEVTSAYVTGLDGILLKGLAEERAVLPLEAVGEPACPYSATYVRHGRGGWDALADVDMHGLVLAQMTTSAGVIAVELSAIE